MNIKSFMDGDRLVIVVEGLKEVPSDEKLLKGFLSAIMPDTETSIHKPSDAAPVPVVEEDVTIPCEEITSDGDIEIKTSFFTGKLNDAYACIDSFSKELEVLNALKDNAEIYLRHKFAGMDTDAYTEKLSDAQKTKFFDVYGAFMYHPLVEAGDVKSAIEYYQGK